MTFDVAVTIAAATFMTAWVLTALILLAARRFKVLDHPNSRSSHSVPTPRVGGFSIVFSVFCVLLVYPLFYQGSTVLYVLLFASSLVAAISLIDDLVNVSAKIRIIVHLIAATLITYVGISTFQEGDGLSSFESVLTFLVGSTLIVWCVNLFNFMDGIDGIAASESAFVSLAGAFFLALVDATEWAVILLVVASSSTAFLTFNWSPARIFLGDVGSVFLGFVLASVAFLSCLEGYLSPVLWLILGGTFLVDATYTLIIRAATGQKCLEPHNLHVYQKLARSYGSHAKATTLYVGVNVIWLFPMAWFAYRHPALELWIAMAALTPLGLGAIRIRGGAAEIEQA